MLGQTLTRNLLFAFTFLILNSQVISCKYIWNCNEKKETCSRTEKSDGIKESVDYPTVESCRLVCGRYGALWPRPTKATTLDKEFLKFHPGSISWTIKAEKKALHVLDDIKIYFHNIISLNKSKCSSTKKVDIKITTKSNNVVLDWNTDESYQLHISKNKDGVIVNINAQTVFGARHGLEALTQLIEHYPEENENCLVILSGATITDQPVYPHRGLLIDTSRNFQNVETIKKHLDAMAASKLNILHWHITDSHSFPLELPNLPNMTRFGAYSPQKIYHPSDIAELKSYALTRGIRILIEIDAPAHAGNGWQWGPESNLGDLAVCVNKLPWQSYCSQPPCGQLNPVNKNIYLVLETLYKDIISAFPEMTAFHMGGDEINIDCWNSSKEITDSLKGKETKNAFVDLWGQFQNKALQAFDRALGKKEKLPIILWTSPNELTNIDNIEKYLPKERYVIQAWLPAGDPLPQKLINLGYKVIHSTVSVWYLNYGYGWSNVYDNKILTESLGGEVCMWGEYVDSSSVLQRTWPRAAAAAERLWSNGDRKKDMAEQRFYRHRERLVTRGINAESLTPEWCYHNEGIC